MPELHVLPTSEDVAQAAAEFVAALSEEQIRTQGRFTIALSGGTTPGALYRALASPRYAPHLVWARWHVFWSDERSVPPDHEESNYRLARETLLEKVPLPAENLHRMRGELAPQEAAAEYEQTLRRTFSGSPPVFDLVLLGLGSDGHTASLFPGTDAVREEHRWVVANWVPRLGSHRLTFTLPLINAARVVAFLVTQQSKAGILRQVQEVPSGQEALPASLVRPAHGTVHWFLTQAAASLVAASGA